MIVIGSRVCGGQDGTDDYDEGRVVAIDGDMADVAWSSGVRTRAEISSLRLLA